MRMVIQATIVRMQHTGSTGHALQLFVVVTELFQRGPTALHQLIINHALMPPGQRSQFGGQGKGQHKITCGQLLLQLPG